MGVINDQNALPLHHTELKRQSGFSQQKNSIYEWVFTCQSVHDIPTSFEMISLLTQSLSWKSQNQISFFFSLPQEEKKHIY